MGLSASNGYFSIHELNFRANQGSGSSGLPCTFKIRSWFDLRGVAFGYGHLRNNPQDDEGRSNPGYEIVMEGTYQIEFAPWLSLQPDVQYVIHPSSTNIANALVLGARTTVSF